MVNKITYPNTREMAIRVRGVRGGSPGGSPDGSAGGSPGGSSGRVAGDPQGNRQTHRQTDRHTEKSNICHPHTQRTQGFKFAARAHPLALIKSNLIYNIRQSTAMNKIPQYRQQRCPSRPGRRRPGPAQRAADRAGWGTAAGCGCCRYCCILFIAVVCLILYMFYI